MIIGQSRMEKNGSILTTEERKVLILAATHPNGQHLNNTEIAQRLCISVNRVKRVIHQACVKLEASNRNEAITLALRRREIKLNELYTFDELIDFWSSLCPHVLARAMFLVCQGMEHIQFPVNDEEIINSDRPQDTILTESERDVLILVGRGLTNREIADELCMTTQTIATYLYRAYTKLGVSKKSDAVLSALRRGEISIGEMYLFNELLEFLSALERESLDKMVQLLSKKLGQELVLTGS